MTGCNENLQMSANKKCLRGRQDYTNDTASQVATPAPQPTSPEAANVFSSDDTEKLLCNYTTNVPRTVAGSNLWTADFMNIIEFEVNM